MVGCAVGGRVCGGGEVVYVLPAVGGICCVFYGDVGLRFCCAFCFLAAFAEGAHFFYCCCLCCCFHGFLMVWKKVGSE